MRKHVTEQRRNGTKGSSMILVLAALLILLAVGSVVVTISAADIQMSSRYNRWSKEYYDLDYAAQERLIAFDVATLGPAEDLARYYLQNGYYSFSNIDEFPDGVGMGGSLKSAFASEDLQHMLYEKALAITSLLESSDPSVDAQEQYDAAMLAFGENAFRVLFYYFVNAKMPAGTSDVSQAATNGIGTVCVLENPSWFPAIGGTFDELNAALSTVPRVRVTAAEAAGPTQKKVDVRISVGDPGYRLVRQTRFVPFKINPLYTNAISAQGGVTFAGSGAVSVTGDVVSSNAGASKGIAEGNTTGIKTTGSTDVTIFGNVYSAGDVHLWGNGSSIVVRGYPTTYSASLKNSLYENAYFYADDAVEGDDPYKETVVAASGGGYLPYVYADNAGGNVYCNNLAIEAGVTGGELSVSGNVWTQDDIQNDGGAASSIEVQKNYIGMSSDALGSDPNGSSAVINNAYKLGGTIRIAGDYIIPGTAFYRFDGGKGTPGSGRVYYQTAESGNTRTVDAFTAYFAETGDPTATYFGDAAGDELYDLYENNLQNKISRFQTKFTAGESGINVKDNASYYSLGVVVDSNGAVRFARTSTYNVNQYHYGLVNVSILPAVFATKTRQYGTSAFAFDTLTNNAFAVSDPTRGFTYLGGGDNYLDVSSIASGIVYSSGNLTIGGSGTFRGSVICRGNLTVNGGVSIVHDEDAVRSALGVGAGTGVIGDGSGSRIARRFFSPAGLTMGENLAIEQIETVSPNTGEREDTGIDRYTIISWKESRF